MPQGRVMFSDGSPAPNVAVVHGSEVTRSGKDGRYRVDGEGGHVVITRPEGWTADPWFHLADAVPTDFEMRPVVATPPWRFAQISDLHLSARSPAGDTEVPNSPGPVIEAVDRLLAAHPGISLLVATGDLTDTGLNTEFEMLATVLDSVPVETVAVPGNHDHMGGSPRFFINERGYGINHGDPKAWERHVGPRWFSLDRCGLHFVVIDWHMWEIGVDREIQEQWIAADLDLHRGMPWVLLSHDQMPGEFFEGLPPPLASFSGHWHTSRTVTVGSTMHVSTPPLTFAGLDHGRAAATVVEWDGDALVVRHHEEPTAELPSGSIRPKWSPHLGPKAGLPAPVMVVDGVLCAVTWDDATGEGFVDAVDVAHGERMWRRNLDVATKSAPVVAGDQVVVTDVAGGTTALDASDGRVRWRCGGVTPLRTWCWASPAIAGDLVISSTPTRVVAHHLADGNLIWERTGLVPHANLLAHSVPLVVGDTVIVGFWPFSPAFFGLRTTDGETVWTVDDPEGGPIEGATGRGTALGPWSPVGPGAATPDRVVFPAAGGWICLDPATGVIVWRRKQDGRFRPARPVPAHGGVVVVSPDDIALLRIDDGEPEWSLRLPEGGLALAPYRATSHVGTAAAGLIDELVVVPGLDGFLYRIDLATGRDLGRVPLGVSSAAPPLITDELLVLLGVEGSLLAFELDEVLA